MAFFVLLNGNIYNLHWQLKCSLEISILENQFLFPKSPIKLNQMAKYVWNKYQFQRLIQADSCRCLHSFLVSLYCSERDIEIYQNPGGLDPYSGESVDIGLFEGPGEVSL